MEIVKINFECPDCDVAKKTAKVLQSGGIVIAPTETVYAIFGNALNEKTIDGILRLKKRNPVKAFSLTLFPIERIFDYAVFNPLISDILEMFSGQPLSLALPKKKTLPDFLNPGADSAAFHFFSCRLDEEIFRHLDIPLVGTSANLSGEPDVDSVEKVMEYFEPVFGTDICPDLILDGGKLEKRNPSAVIKIMGENITVVRGGDISQEEMQEKIDNFLERL